MKANQITIGSVYTARVSGKHTTVRVDKIEIYDPSFNPMALRPARNITLYRVTNLITGCKLTFRSAAKFRSLVTVKQAAREFVKGIGGASDYCPQCGGAIGWGAEFCDNIECKKARNDRQSLPAIAQGT